MRAITYRTFELRRRDKNTRIVEIFGPACGDLALSTAASVAAATSSHDVYTARRAAFFSSMLSLLRPTPAIAVSLPTRG